MQYVPITYMNVRKSLMIENIVNWIYDYTQKNKLTTWSGVHLYANNNR